MHGCRTHADNADLVVLELLCVILVGELLLGEDIGVADLDSTLGDLRDALAGTATLDRDLDIRVGLHELLGCSLDERLECRGADSGDAAGQTLRLARAGVCGGRAATAAGGKSETCECCSASAHSKEATTGKAL